MSDRIVLRDKKTREVLMVIDEELTIKEALLEKENKKEEEIEDTKDGE